MGEWEAWGMSGARDQRREVGKGAAWTDLRRQCAAEVAEAERASCGCASRGGAQGKVGSHRGPLCLQCWGGGGGSRAAFHPRAYLIILLSSPRIVYTLLDIRSRGQAVAGASQACSSAGRPPAACLSPALLPARSDTMIDRLSGRRLGLGSRSVWSAGPGQTRLMSLWRRPFRSSIV